MVNILIVEDDPNVGGLLCDFIKAEGYTYCHAKDGDEAVEMFLRYNPQLVLLDVVLPKLNGFAVCEKIREQSNTPVMMITAKTRKEDKLSGLVLGADDYIEKPYDIDILLAKIKGIFKRRYDNETICIGDIELDVVRRVAYKAGAELLLTVKEFDLLLLLMENAGKTLKKEYIFNQVWGVDSFSEAQTLTVHIKWLRQKIENDAKPPIYIATVWGVGYRFLK